MKSVSILLLVGLVGPFFCLGWNGHCDSWASRGHLAHGVVVDKFHPASFVMSPLATTTTRRISVTSMGYDPRSSFPIRSSPHHPKQQKLRPPTEEEPTPPLLLTLRHDYWALRHGQSLANVQQVIASDPATACHEYGLTELGRQQAQRAAEDMIPLFRQGPAVRSSSSSSLSALLTPETGCEETSTTTTTSPYYYYYDHVLLLSSDFRRAQETAQAAVPILRQAGIPLLGEEGLILDTRLRERWFGAWDGQSDQHYEDVWQQDARDPHHTEHQVESVASVLERVTACLLDWDQRLSSSSTALTDDGSSPPSSLVTDNQETPTALSPARPHNKFMVVLVAHGDVLQILQTAFEQRPASQHRQVEPLPNAQLRYLGAR